MGYYILGIIIFLLLAVFISDLVRSARDSDNIDTFDTDEYFDRLSSQYPGTFSYREEFSEDYIEQETNNEENMKNFENKEERNDTEAAFHDVRPDEDVNRRK